MVKGIDEESSVLLDVVKTSIVVTVFMELVMESGSHTDSLEIMIAVSMVSILFSYWEHGIHGSCYCY